MAMYFRNKITIRGMQINMRAGESKTIEIGGVRDAKVAISIPSKEEQAVGHKWDNPHCDIYTTYSPGSAIQKAFNDLLMLRVPKDSCDPSGDDWQRYLEVDGSIKPKHVLPSSLMPQKMQSFMQTVREESSDLARRTVKILRWHHGTWTRHDAIASRGNDWSIDGNCWQPMPHSTSIWMIPGTQLSLTDRAADSLRIALQSDTDEPIGHELFREAWSGMNGNLRSALILGVASAEVGTKTLISRLIPRTEWLVANIPSPPLVQIISEFIPSLPVVNSFNGKVLWWSDLIPVLRKCVSIRNQISHNGNIQLRHDTVEELLLTVRDYLWLLDYYSGEQWALAHIRSEILQDIESQQRG